MPALGQKRLSLEPLIGQHQADNIRFTTAHQGGAGRHDRDIRRADQPQHKLKPDSTTLNKLWPSEASGQAAILFKQTNMTVSEVNAVTLQYNDAAAFKKAYKRETGMTPSESKV